MRLSRLLYFFIAFFSLQFAYAQTGSIRGHIYDDASGEPVIFANIFIVGTNFGTNSDDNGFYTFSDVPVGVYNIEVSYLGYDNFTQEVEVKPFKINYYQIDLKSGGINLGVIDISAEREQARAEVSISKLQVTQKQIKALPSTGGDADIIQYLQVLPGIISTGDQGGQLYIRGGSPVQNKILLDGLTIYNPFHSIGFYSTFETEIIRSVDVLTGGFNAEHGGRISAVVDINTKEGNRKHLGGQASISPFMVKAVLDGPLIKQGDSGNSLSFVLTSKRSIIDHTSKTLYGYAVDNDSIGLPFQFQDSYGKLSYITANGSKFNFFGFNFSDKFDNPLVSKINWGNKGGGLTFNLLPTASELTMNGIVGLSTYDIAIIETDNTPRRSSIREAQIGLDFNYITNESAFKYGVEVKSVSTEFEFTNPFGLQLSEDQNTTEISGFLKFRRSWDKLVIEPGFRLQYYASQSDFSPEPRLGLKWNINDATRFKMGAGIYSQNIISTSNERDVVNLFNGFLSSPETQFKDLEGNAVDSKLQKSRQVVGGIERDIGTNFQLNLEGYYKDFTQLVVINRNKEFNDDADFATEIGDAYGLDISGKYENSRLYVWATYSLGYVNRFDGEETFPTVYDRRHNVNFLTTYTLGEKKDLLLSFRWNMGSGFPFTQTQGFYNSQTFQEGVGTEYETANPDQVGIIYSDERNGGRLPYYHRLDLSAQKTITFTDRINLEITASVTNAYDRNNIFFFDRIQFERVDQLPIIPSLSGRLNF